MKAGVVFAAFVALAAGCSSAPRQSAPAADSVADSAAGAPELIQAPAPRVIGGTPAPMAVAYRTNGDYHSNVPVNVSATGQLLSYPAPADLRDAEPLPLTGGYLLDRRGIGPNTVFTRYTYAQYSALPQAPAPDSILAAVIPGARVTASVTLPFTLAEALADTTAVNNWLKTH